MTVLVSDAITSNVIFLAIFLFALIFSIRKRTDDKIFSIRTTQELKGLAILAIVFAHIGLYLVSDSQFLYPLSISAGVGVDIFLFLSGYGLTVSALTKPMSIKKFYQNRLGKLYLSFWLVILVFVTLDALLNQRFYAWEYLGKAFLGFFSRANLWDDLNSPLWFITLMVFYYLSYPLLLYKKRPWISAIIIYLITREILKQDLSILKNIYFLYQLHIMAFPLGMIAADLVLKIKEEYIFKLKKLIKPAVYYLIYVGLVWLAGYTIYYSNIGTTPFKEQITSIISMSAIILLFILKKWEIKLLYIFGVYSYEIYLLHWPIMARFDLIYKVLPAWLATLLYLIIFLGLGMVLNKLTNIFLKRKTSA